MARALPFFALTALVALMALPARAKVDPAWLRCLVCRSSIDEFEKAVSQLDPKKKIEVGNYRLDETGNIEQDKVPLSKSQIYLSDMLDSVCDKLADYVRVRYKATQKLGILKMMNEFNQMNPDLSLTDFVTDEDLNKSLEYYCEDILGEHEDKIIDIYSKRPSEELPDGKQEFCNDFLNLCEDWMLPTPADTRWSVEQERARGSDPYGFGPGEMQQNPFAEDEENQEFEELEEDVGELEMKDDIEKDEL